MRTLFVLIITLVANTVLAAPPPLKAAEQRVLQEVVMLGTLKSVSEKYGVACTAPTKAQSIKWMCLNGESCGYSVQVVCSDATLIAPAQVSIVISFMGIDSGFEATLTQVNIDKQIAERQPKE